MTVLSRFLNYVRYESTSIEEVDMFPSSPGQRQLGRMLFDELTAMGMQRVSQNGDGYVCAYLPASEGREEEPAIGFVAHVDTSPDVSGRDVQPSVIEYQGGDIVLPYTTLTQAQFPCLANYEGKHLVTTDGSTLLGADDKAGVAEIMAACDYLLTHPEVSHRAVAVCFTPDEEIGRGADRFPYADFAAKAAYTVDGGELGEIEYENFNAASAVVKVNGVNIHPGAAKNKMKNAVLLANQLITMLPPAETPAHTEGYEGFYHVSDMTANESMATIKMIIRDHDRDTFESRKTFLKGVVEYLNGVWGEDTFSLELTDSYYNMKEKIEPHFYLIENARAAMEAVGVTPKIIPIRGGTDGARLSYEGLPCPNLSTGGFNFHSIHECVCVESMEKMVEILVELTK